MIGCWLIHVNSTASSDTLPPHSPGAASRDDEIFSAESLHHERESSTTPKVLKILPPCWPFSHKRKRVLKIDQSVKMP